MFFLGLPWVFGPGSGILKVASGQHVLPKNHDTFLVILSCTQLCQDLLELVSPCGTLHCNLLQPMHLHRCGITAYSKLYELISFPVYTLVLFVVAPLLSRECKAMQMFCPKRAQSEHCRDDATAFLACGTTQSLLDPSLLIALSASFGSTS